MTAGEAAIEATAGFVRRRRLSRLWRRFVARKPAVVGLALSTMFVMVAVLAPVLAPHEPGASDFDDLLAVPSAQHLMGTDDLGRDVFSRVVFGARASIQAGVLATALAMVVAVPIGMVSGYYRGWLDAVVGRLVDTMLSFPFVVLAVGLAAILGPSLTNASIAIGVAQVPRIVRITRGETLSIREEDFIAGAVADGASDPVILGRHVLPNIMNPLLVQATVVIPEAIIGESVLSFLGLGVQPPTPSWGVMLSLAQPYLTDALWLAIFPGLAIFLATLSFNLLGDGLRDVLDPKSLV